MERRRLPGTRVPRPVGGRASAKRVPSVSGGETEAKLTAPLELAEAWALSEAAAELCAEVQRDKQNATFAGHNGGMDARVSAALALLRLVRSALGRAGSLGPHEPALSLRLHQRR